MALFLWRIRTVCVKQQDETENTAFQSKQRQKQTYFQSQAVKRRARHYNISISGKFQRFSRANGYDWAAASEQKSGVLEGRWRGRREQKAELKGRAEVQGVRGEHILVKNQQQHHFPVTSLFETQVRHRSDNCIHAFTVRSDCGLFWRSHFLLFLFISAFL